jgi:hypothetical protein
VYVDEIDGVRVEAREEGSDERRGEKRKKGDQS